MFAVSERNGARKCHSALKTATPSAEFQRIRAFLANLVGRFRLARGLRDLLRKTTNSEWLGGRDSQEFLFVLSPPFAFSREIFIQCEFGQNGFFVRSFLFAGRCGLCRLDVTQDVTRRERLPSLTRRKRSENSCFYTVRRYSLSKRRSYHWPCSPRS